MFTYSATHICDEEFGLNPINEVSGDFRGRFRGHFGIISGLLLTNSLNKKKFESTLNPWTLRVYP